jgi:two-component system chemotaxis response regulator CheB
MQKIVVIGGSAGSIEALKVILGGLQPDFAAAVLVVTHIGARDSILPSLLERCTPLRCVMRSTANPSLPDGCCLRRRTCT